MKTHGHVKITNSKPDGSFDWHTAWNQSLHAPPRPFLDNPGQHTQEPTSGPVAPRPPDPPRAEPPPPLTDPDDDDQIPF